MANNIKKKTVGKRLSLKQNIIVASTLFGMFFGAGNLIFPVHLGQLSGSNYILVTVGFIISAVGLPILGVAAIGGSKVNSVFDLVIKAGKPFGYFFCCLVVLTIGPFFAVPRCGSTSFTAGIAPLLPDGTPETIPLLIFSALFFIAVLIFSLKPKGISTWVGKIINPAFLVCLFILIFVALVNPIADASKMAPSPDYVYNSILNGAINGYETMDAISALLFGTIVVEVIKNMGVKDSADVAKDTIKSGLFTALAMGVIYFLITLLGAQSLGQFEIAENGGITLAQICGYYFGEVGNVIMAFIVILACIKTAIGIITCSGRVFNRMFPKGPSYTVWVIVFVAVSFLISNVGLTQIINFSVPVLYLVYPLCICVIVLSLFGKFFEFDHIVYKFAIYFTLVPSIFICIGSFDSLGFTLPFFRPLIDFSNIVFPLNDLGLGWVVPFVLGVIIGLIIHFVRKKKLSTGR